MIEFELNSIIRFKDNNDAIRCVLRGISKDCTEAMIFSIDERVCTDDKDIELEIYTPVENSPIKCTGKIIWEPSYGKQIFKGYSGYLAKVYINSIGRLDQKRMNVIISQKRAFISGSP